MSLDATDKSERIQEMIRREQKLLDGARSMSASTSNTAVLQQCRAQIRMMQNNIQYLESELRRLSVSGPDAQRQPSKPSGGPLELLRYDNKFMGQRIQLMLQTLDFKLSLEKQYKPKLEKLRQLYQQEGDKQARDEATANLADITAKIELLRYALKKYSDMKLDNFLDSAEPVQENVRRPVTGTLHLFVTQIDGVDHTNLSTSRNVETKLFIKVENQLVASSCTTKGDVFNEEFNIPVEKANEIEILAYDKAGSSQKPVAVMWMRINDIIEAIRRKRVQSHVTSGWANADTVIREASVATTKPASKPIRGPNGQSTAPSMLLGSPEKTRPASTPDDTVEGWFILEPAGRIYLRMGFDKNVTGPTHVYKDGLDRHNAIRKQEDATIIKGHQFVHQRFYSVMRCAICENFMTFPFQCSECRFACHKDCAAKVVTKCISKTAKETGNGDEQLNYRIPHKWDPSSNMSANWCCHCGTILPFGKKKIRKCGECGIMCHSSCVRFVPDFCGTDMETAARILNTIKLTKFEHNKRSAAASTTTTLVNSSTGSLPSNNPYIGGKPTQHHVHTAPATAPNPNNKHVNRKKVPDSAHTKTSSDSSGALRLDLDLGGNTTWWADESTEAMSLDPRAQQQKEKERAYHQNQHQRTQVQQEQYQQARNQQSQPSLDLPSLEPQPEPEPEPVRKPEPISKIPTRDARAEQEKEASVAAEVLLDGVEKRRSRQSIVGDGQVSKSHRRRHKVGLDDFSFLAVLGKGNFGKVMLAESKHTQKLYAIKVLKKNFIIDNREVESTRSEKNVFLIANKESHPFLINLFACFQTANRIYFVMDYVSGGDLMYHIQKDLFTASQAQYYAAEVLLALSYFHDNNVIYRDLKLDNILLTLDGHIKIADYGLCKENMGYGQTTGTFCGTPDFIAPEILLDQKYGRSVDWWALGVLMYQMLLGKSPFRGKDEDEVYDAILSDEPLYPIHMPKDSVSILQQLLERDPSRRLGSGPDDAKEIMDHPYFHNINFDDLLNLRVKPPYKPEIDSPTDVRYFDKEFTSEMPALTPMNSTLTPAMQEEFRGFSYVFADQV